MISLGTQKLLKQYLIQLAKLEKSLEPIREKLCEIDEFEPYSVFKFISQGKATIKLEDLQQLNNRDIKVQAIIAAILNNDTTYQGQLSYNDFLRMVIVNDNLNLRQQVAFREKQMIATEQMIDTILELIEKEGMGYLSLKKYKDQLQKRYDFDTYDYFRFLDTKKDNYLDLQEFVTILGKDDTYLAVFLQRALTNHLNLSKIPYENFKNILNDRDNYVIQFQDEKLQKKQSQHRTPNKSPFNPYEKQNRSIRLNTSSYSMRTPDRQPFSQSFILKTPERDTVQSHFLQSKILKTPTSEFKMIRTNEMNDNEVDQKQQWTPVRKIHKDSVHQKIEKFHKKAATTTKNILRHSPINQVQTRQFFEPSQSFKFNNSKTTTSSKNISQLIEKIKYNRKWN